MEHVRRSKGLTLAEKRVIYGPLLGFHARAMEDFSWEVHAASPVWSDEWVTIQRKLCERDADSCDLLARYLAARGKEREAAQIYQRGIDEAVNVIRAANNSGWLVGYYLDHGEKARALAIAQMAANVYSATGLLVMARTLERLGRLDEAEAYHRKVIERYEGDAAFTGFLFRQVNERGLTRYEPELRRRLAASFPRGPEKLDMAQLGSPPPDGVRIAYPSDFTRLEGIDVSDVIVAVDGWRVHTGRQYSYACEFSRGFRLEIEVWRDGTYRQVHAFLPMRFLGVELTPYTSGARAGVPAKSPR